MSNKKCMSVELGSNITGSVLSAQSDASSGNMGRAIRGSISTMRGWPGVDLVEVVRTPAVLTS